jgi:3'-phosphoadenosine 5'-phosphosulfate (PAPS) 3'-phosphatase
MANIDHGGERVWLLRAKTTTALSISLRFCLVQAGYAYAFVRWGGTEEWRCGESTDLILGATRHGSGVMFK